MDYRNLNAITYRPIFPIPETKHLLDNLAGSKYFSSLDLSSAYYQVPVAENDKEKTAFATRLGHYEFNRMPFGLSGAPATFQKLMHTVLKTENWSTCLVYLDDVLIYGKDFDQHMERLELVLRKIHEAGLKLSPQKCNFLQRSLKFLGHVIEENGISPDYDKIKKVKEWPKPVSVEELRSFLGFTNYYRRFINKYAELTAPLERMMKNSANGNINLQKKKPLNWDIETEKNFNMLKEKLTSPPILSYPTRTGQFILDTDASHEGMGAVLSQMQDGVEKVIEYSSKKFTKSELRYCVTRKELLAVYNFMLQFRHYLLGRQFIVRSDHRALIWMLNWERPNTSQYCKWIAEMEQFDFIIQHRPGKEHSNADFLSRESQCQQCEIPHDNPLRRRNTKILKIIGNDGNNNQNIIDFYHNELGHVGVSKLIGVLKENGYGWQKMDMDVQELVGKCLECAQRKQGRIVKTQQMHIEADSSFNKIMMDITGPLTPRSRYGYRYILGIVDVFSRYSMFIPMRTTDSETIIKQFFKRWISIFGYPKHIITDNAPNLDSEKLKDFCTDNGIKKSCCSPYYPQGNGIIERLFRTVKDRLFATSVKKGIDWADSIPYIELGLRSTTSTKTGYSPHEIVFGSRLKLPRSLIRQDGVQDFDAYMSILEKWISGIEERVRNKNLHVNVANKYIVGDYVMAKSVSTNGWFEPKFIGPCRIVEILHPKVYKLRYQNKMFIRNEHHLKPSHLSNMEKHSLNVDRGSRKEETEMPRPIRNRNTVNRYGFSN